MFVITNYRMDEVFFIYFGLYGFAFKVRKKTHSNGSSSYNVKCVFKVVFGSTGTMGSRM